VTGAAPPIDILVAYRGQALVVFLLVSLACLGIGFVLVRSQRRGGPILWALTGASLLAVLALTLVPSGYDTRDEIWCTVQIVAPTLGRIELVANIALFFPLAFFATLASRRPLVVLVAGTGLSAAVEGIQAVAPVIGRACDTNDWVMNTIGTVVGVLLAVGTMAVARRGSRAED
jgi:VanZ family protein